MILIKWYDYSSYSRQEYNCHSVLQRFLNGFDLHLREKNSIGIDLMITTVHYVKVPFCQDKFSNLLKTSLSLEIHSETWLLNLLTCLNILYIQIIKTWLMCEFNSSPCIFYVNIVVCNTNKIQIYTFPALLDHICCSYSYHYRPSRSSSFITNSEYKQKHNQWVSVRW